MAEVRGVVEDIVFTNKKNGYSILEITTEGGPTLTVRGVMPFPASGENIEAVGEYTTHAVYGQQFNARIIRRTSPKDAPAILAFLSSGVVKGIGLVTARRIVSTFGTDAMEIIENTPERLAEVKGITPAKAEEIGTAFRKISLLRSLTEFLSSSGLDAMLAMKLYGIYGDDSVNVILANPYMLITDGLSDNFRAVDNLGRKQGYDLSSKSRVNGALFYLLVAAKDDGHCFLPRSELLERASRLCEIDYDCAASCLDEAGDKLIFVMEKAEGEPVYLPGMYKSECHVADMLRSISKLKFKVPKGLALLIEKAAESQMIDFSARQKEALRVASECGAMVLTGGPGTGKTTAIRGIIAILEGLGATVSLAAPTGRAAKRMSELCGREAKTIHRLLEIGVDKSGEMYFTRNITNRLEADVIILDELSMVDVELMESLLDALKDGSRLVMVGDADQLPSVGPGNLLSDIIESDIVPCVHLDEIFRQAKESNIIVASHEVNSGRMPSLGLKTGDLFFIRRPDPASITQTIIDLAINRLPKNLGINPDDIQVIIPNRKNEGGTEQMNPLLQAAFNPYSKAKGERKSSYVTFREGDRVMQTVNNYELEWRKNNESEIGLGVFNGDTGIILSISNESHKVVVRFDERTVVYDFDMLDQLELAYAVTVHKAQGSEYPVVIFSAGLYRSRLLTRCLLYTAMTRAKKLLIIVGNENCIEEMVSNNRKAVRYSRLRERLCGESTH